jgi:SAM-dependent methyltransferase
VSETKDTSRKMFVGAPPTWALRRPKPILQRAYDLLGAPFRMVLLPDHQNERLHLTSLRAERMAAVLPLLHGRVLDVGAGDNMLLQLYRAHSGEETGSIGLDVVEWGGGCVIVPDCRRFPFSDAEFDTVSFIACLNHIPERVEALAEARRVLKTGGHLVVTMIGKLVGGVGHAIWWYSEDKKREVQEGEVMGMNPREVKRLIENAGFVHVAHRRFLYGLNSLYVAER